MFSARSGAFINKSTIFCFEKLSFAPPRSRVLTENKEPITSLVNLSASGYC